jgi:hypothetical protein
MLIKGRVQVPDPQVRKSPGHSTRSGVWGVDRAKNSGGREARRNHQESPDEHFTRLVRLGWINLKGEVTIFRVGEADPEPNRKVVGGREMAGKAESRPLACAFWPANPSSRAGSCATFFHETALQSTAWHIYCSVIMSKLRPTTAKERVP